MQVSRRLHVSDVLVNMFFRRSELTFRAIVHRAEVPNLINNTGKGKTLEQRGRHFSTGMSRVEVVQVVSTFEIGVDLMRFMIIHDRCRRGLTAAAAFVVMW